MKHSHAGNAHSPPAVPHRQPHASDSANRDEQAIRERAYAIHEAHGDTGRSPERDWLEAEEQLKLAHSGERPMPRS